MFSDKPSKPLNLKIDKADKTKVTISWEPPESDGGAEIFNYAVEYREEGAFKWIRFSPDQHINETTCTVKGLKEKTVYEFHVAAENKAGMGPYCEPTAPVQAKEHIGQYD